MKKLLIAMLGIGLVSNSLNAINLLRTWQCRPTNPQPTCSLQDKNDAKEVFKTVMLEKLVDLFAESGIAVTMRQLQQERDAATQPSTAQRMQQFKETKQALEASERQRQQSIQRIAK